MNVKIQGSGNGTYANTGSCVAVTNYLQHEDLERMKKGEEVQPFFNQFRDYVSAREVTFKIDNNKAKLSRTDAKFYVITVSPYNCYMMIKLSQYFTRIGPATELNKRSPLARY